MGHKSEGDLTLSYCLICAAYLKAGGIYLAVSMNFSKIEKTVYDIAVPVAEEKNFFVYDVEYVKEGASRFLRIYIDKDGGISIDECEEFSRAFSELFDKVDPISENYYLEVSSPGIERKIRRREHFESAKGETVDIGLYAPIDGEKTITGELLGLDENDNVLVISGGENKSIPLSKITGINVHFEF